MANVEIKNSKAKVKQAPKPCKATAKIDPIALPTEGTGEDALWDELLGSITDAEYDVLLKKVQLSVERNGTRPLDFDRE